MGSLSKPCHDEHDDATLMSKGGRYGVAEHHAPTDDASIALGGTITEPTREPSSFRSTATTTSTQGFSNRLRSTAMSCMQHGHTSGKG